MGSRASLAALPAEIIFLISSSLPKLSDLTCLIRCCSALRSRITPFLYTIVARDYPCMLPWASSYPQLAPLVQELLLHGADPSILCLKWPEVVDTESLDQLTELRTVFRDSDRFNPREKYVPPDQLDLDPHITATADNFGYIITEQSLQSRLPARHLRRAWCWSSIHIASITGNTPVVKVLLEHARKQGGDKLKFLLASVACGYTHNPKEISCDFLGRSVDNGNWLDSETGVAIYRQPAPLHAPLHVALQAGHDGTARVLADAIVEAGLLQEVGCDALHFTARYGCLDTMRCLVRGGVDVDARDRQGWTALTYAIVGTEENAGRSDPEPAREDAVMECLLELGADVNASLDQDALKGPDDSHGLTHLHLACWQKQWRRAIRLLEQGANPHAVYARATADPVDEDEDLIEGEEAIDYWFPGCEGPFRPIDLVCLEPVPVWAWGPRRSTVEWDDRMELLQRLVKDHRVDLGPCPGQGRTAENGPVVMAALNPGGAARLLSAFLEAGRSFESDKETVQKVLQLGQPAWRNATIRWLVDHGARVRSDAEDSLLFFDVTQVIRGDISVGLGCIVIQTMNLLLCGGGLNPAINGKIGLDDWEGGERKRSDETYCLLRAVLRQNLARRNRDDVQQLITALLRFGVKPPRMVDMLSDFTSRLPALLSSKNFVCYDLSEVRLRTGPNEWAESSHSSERGTEEKLDERLRLLQEDLLSIIELIGRYLVNPGIDEIQRGLFQNQMNTPGVELRQGEALAKLAEEEREAAVLISDLMEGQGKLNSEEMEAKAGRFMYLVRKCRASILHIS